MIVMQKPLRNDGDIVDAELNRDPGEEEQTLHPFPEGWYFVADRRTVLKKKLLEKQWMGENIVVWCDHGGRSASPGPCVRIWALHSGLPLEGGCETVD
ncbi:MAG: hypothetical protein OXE86_15220 [Alphaproteobacteria bacterium]|nr:hypothetical protein [Alphaproteobacteria bacterium]